MKHPISVSSLMISISNIVYKVIIAVNPLMMKKAKKLGIDVQYKTIIFDDLAIDLNKMKKKCSK